MSSDGKNSRLQTLPRFTSVLAPLDRGVSAYRRLGSGPAVVLLHGIGSGAGCWLDATLALAEHCSVLAWDAPGYGLSTPLSVAQPSSADYAERLHQVLTHAAIDECVLVGHSLGALVAAAYCARQERARIARLVLLSPARGYGASSAQDRESVRTKRLDTLERLGIDGMAGARASALLSPAATPDLVQWAAWNMRQITPDGYRQAVHLLCDGDLLAGLKPAFPVDVRVGIHDTITPAPKCQAIASAWQASFELIAGAGHACHIERPREVAEIVRQARAGS